MNQTRICEMGAEESPRVLKADAARRLGSKVAFNYEDLQRRCERHIEQARRQVQQMLEEAETEAESLRSRAQDQGHQAGLEQGLHDADAEIQRRANEQAERRTAERLQSLVPALQNAAEALKQERERWVSEWESLAVRVSTAIAEKLVHRTLEIDPAAAREMIVEVLQIAAGTPELKVCLHPQDRDLLGEEAESVVQSLTSCGRAVVVPDSSLAPGDCVIETRHGTIDARVDTQLERIVSELLQQNEE